MKKLVQLAENDFALWEVSIKQFFEFLRDFIVVMAWLFVYLFVICFVLLIVMSIFMAIYDWVKSHRK